MITGVKKDDFDELSITIALTKGVWQAREEYPYVLFTYKYRRFMVSILKIVDGRILVLLQLLPGNRKQRLRWAIPTHNKSCWLDEIEDELYTMYTSATSGRVDIRG